MKLSFLLASIIFASSANAAVFSNTDVHKLTYSIPATGKSSTYYFNEDHIALKKPVTYNLKVYQIDYKEGLTESSGVYDDKSSSLNIDKGKLLSDVEFVGKPVGSASIKHEIPYIESVETEVKDSLKSSKTVKMGSLETGFHLSIYYKGNDNYFINISQTNLEEMTNFTSGGDTVQLPQLKKCNILSDSLHIAEGKTVRFNACEYSVDGKKYQDVYLLSAKK